MKTIEEQLNLFENKEVITAETLKGIFMTETGKPAYQIMAIGHASGNMGNASTAVMNIEYVLWLEKKLADLMNR